MTNISGGYIPILPINPFHYLITLEMCVIYMTELSWACQGKTNVLAFSFFSLFEVYWNYLQKINNLTLFKNTLFCGAFSFYLSDFHFGRIGHSNFIWDRFLSLIMTLQVLYSDLIIVLCQLSHRS